LEGYYKGYKGVNGKYYNFVEWDRGVAWSWVPDIWTKY